MAAMPSAEIDGAPEDRKPRSELRWIDWLQRRAARNHSPGTTAQLLLGIGDDCAILRPDPEEDLLVTTDFTLEGRHFRRDWHSPESAGHRTLARGLSDLAAMGARPLAAFLSLAIPAHDAVQPPWTERFLEGFLTLAERVSVPLAGGDTSASPSEHLLADVVLLGVVPRGTALRRSGARAGDHLYVTGTLGGAAAELRTLAEPRQAGKSFLSSHPQFYPEPRLAAGARLRSERLASACIDLSDGLSTDLGHLCQASKLSAIVDWDLLPISPWVELLDPETQEWAMLHGGEDYELLFSAAPDAPLPASIAGVPVTRIGTLHAPNDALPDVRLRRRGKDELLRPGGWEHLR